VTKSRINMPTRRLANLALALSIVAGLGAAAPARASWSLVWADEFNAATLDATAWTPDIGTGCPSLCGWGNGELEYYRSQNVTLSGGNLVITARAESYGGAAYTSGKITTRGKKTFLYGRMEMRAKLPVGDGMWPAFWMMPQDNVYGGWASSGEIDIMEASNAMTSIAGTLHFGGVWPDNTSSGGSYSMGGGSFASAYHTYAIEWEPDVMRWYVDDVLFSTKTSAQWYSNAVPGNARAPFDQPFYIILNAAVGGYYTGCTSSSCVTATFPQQYLIDYVRVYQDIPNNLPTVAITSPLPGSSLPAGDIVINATASDSDGTITTVEFRNGTTLLGADTTAPYSFTWAAVPAGCATITAKAIDNLGGVANSTVDLTIGAGCGQIGFTGDPFVLPGRIQAENYDGGGEGIAFHDLDATNNGGLYRPSEGVDIEACTDTGGGFNTGWTNPGEWMEYTVTAQGTGSYTLKARVSSLSGGGKFRVTFGGVDKTGEITVPTTGGWQTWTTVTTTVMLDAGTQVMRFAPTASGFNFNWLELTPNWASAAPGVPALEPMLDPCRPNPFNPSTTISYELPAAATVSLAVYDVAGKVVRTLVAAESVDAGRHEVTWNGRDDAGRAAPAGVYFCRLDAGGATRTQRMTLLK
jgi:beta-glucanase (GH16 family)